MKIAGTVARYLMGLIFLFFGSNSFIHFVPNPPPQPGPAGEYLVLMTNVHYLLAVSIVMLAGAVLLLVNRYVALGLTLLGPILVNILLFHITMAPGAIWLALFVTLLWFLVFWQHRAAFKGLFQARLGD